MMHDINMSLIYLHVLFILTYVLTLTYYIRYTLVVYLINSYACISHVSIVHLHRTYDLERPKA